MKKYLSFICLIAFLIFTPIIRAADTFEATTCRSGSMTMVQSGNEIMILGFELKGITQSDSEMFKNASEICVGTLKRMGNESTQLGYCKYLYPNGDINLIEWDGAANNGKWQYLFGTGKWQNIKGGGTWRNIQRAKAISEGTFQNCITMEGSYELPE